MIITQPDFRQPMDAAELSELIIKMKQELALDRPEVVIEPDWQLAVKKLRS